MRTKLWVISISIGLLFLASPVMAAMTISDVEFVSMGNKRAALGTLAFDSSYAFGGEALSGVSLGMDAIDRVFIESKNGYTFEYDHSNKKIKVLSQTPPIIYEEKQTAGLDGKFTLNYPAAFIVSVVRSGGTAYPIIYAGTTTIGTRTSCLPDGFQDGVRTAVSVYNVATVNSGSSIFYVTYATQAWKDLYDLVVQNELMTGAGVTRHTISGNSIWALQCVKQDGALSGVTPIDWADTAGTGEMQIDYQDCYNAGNTGVTQAVCIVPTGSQTYYISYLKQPPSNSWLANRYVRDEDATAGTSIMQLDKPLLLWLTSGYGFSSGDASLQIVSQDQPAFYMWGYDTVHGDALNNKNSGVSEMFTTWGYRGPASNAAAPTAAQVWSVLDSGNFSMTHATYLFGHPWEIPNVVPLEVQNGVDLSDLTGVKVMIIGY